MKFYNQVKFYTEQKRMSQSHAYIESKYQLSSMKWHHSSELVKNLSLPCKANPSLEVDLAILEQFTSCSPETTEEHIFQYTLCH